MMSFRSARYKLHRTLRWPYKLAVYTYGSKDKPTVVLLHGINNSSKSWLPVISQLKKNAYVVSVDLLGFGDSPKPDDIDYTPEEHLRSLRFTLRNLKIKEPFILVGHSMGAILAVHYAAAEPKKIKDIVLCSFPYYRPSDLTAGLAAKWALTADKALYALYAWLRAHPETTIKGASFAKRVKRGEVAFELSQDKWLPFHQSLLNTIEAQDLTPLLSKLSMPIYIVSGRLDPLLNTVNVKRLATTKPNIVLHTAPSGHDLTKNLSKKVATVVDELI